MMQRKHLVWPFALAVGVLCSGLDLDRPALAQEAGTLVMVVNKGNASTAAISKSDARKLLMGQTVSWPNGEKVVVVLGPERSTERVAVLQKVCGMTEAEFTRYQLQIIFAGRPATALQEENSAAAARSFVKANPGAIAFMHEADVDKELRIVLKVE